MLYIDFEGNTEKDAIQLALDSLGLTINDVTIESLKKEKKGLFGLGKKEKAKIRVYYKEKSEINDLIENVKQLISLLDNQATIDVQSTADNKYIISIESLNSSHLIGRNGKTIQAIQNIVTGMLQKFQGKYQVLIDVDNYKDRKHQTIIDEAVSTAKRVQKSKKPIHLKPMNPYERRLVHMELKKMKNISTASEGDGRIKKIKVLYK